MLSSGSASLALEMLRYAGEGLSARGRLCGYRTRDRTRTEHSRQVSAWCVCCGPASRRRRRSFPHQYPVVSGSKRIVAARLHRQPVTTSGSATGLEFRGLVTCGIAVLQKETNMENLCDRPLVTGYALGRRLANARLPTRSYAFPARRRRDDVLDRAAIVRRPESHGAPVMRARGAGLASMDSRGRAYSSPPNARLQGRCVL